jgi:putative phage-type endonuclease
MGSSPWKGRWQLWSEKRGELAGPEETDAMRWGHYLEDDAADEYERQTGRKLIHLGNFTVLRSIRHPFMSSTHDRLVAPIDDRGVGVLSIKTTSAYNADDWKDGAAPMDYRIQLQHELDVSGCRWGSFAVVIGGQKLVWHDVERNDAFIEALRPEEAEFWRMVQAGEEPPPDGVLDREALRRRWPAAVDGPPVQLPAGSDAWDAALERALDEKRSAAAALKSAESRVHEIEAMFRVHMKDQTLAICANGARYSLKVVKQPARTTDAYSYRTLRRIE